MSSQWHAVEHHSVEVDQVGLQGLWMGYQAEAEGNVMLPGPMTTFLNKMGQGGGGGGSPDGEEDGGGWRSSFQPRKLRAMPKCKTSLQYGTLVENGQTS